MRLIVLAMVFGLGSARAEVIDAHLHMLSPDNFGDKQLTAKQVIPLLDQAKVGRAVVLSAGYRLREEAKAKVENDFVAKQVAAFPRRLIGFCAVHVLEPWAVKELERCKKDLKLRGLKLHPNAQQVDLGDAKHLEKLSAVLTKAGELGMPVIIDSNCKDETAVSNLVKLVFGHPKTTIILAHALNIHFRHLARFAMLRLEQPGAAANVYVDVSGIAAFYGDGPERASIAWHLRKFGTDHVLFGSDFPVFTPKQSLAALSKFGFTKAELAAITGGNLARLLPP